jgi:hypothetical protein
LRNDPDRRINLTGIFINKAGEHRPLRACNRPAGEHNANWKINPLRFSGLALRPAFLSSIEDQRRGARTQRTSTIAELGQGLNRRFSHPDLPKKKPQPGLPQNCGAILGEVQERERVFCGLSLRFARKVNLLNNHLADAEARHQ